MTRLVAAAGPVIPNFGGGSGGSSCVRHNGFFCWDWVKSNWGDTFQPALLDHLKLTAIAVGVGFAIAFAVALLAYRSHWLEGPFSLVTGILYTIPSLALFELLVPITGLTTLTVEIPLVTYTLLILFRNTLVGLRGVPADVREAARGMGLTRRETLWRVEVPMAVPAIFAGLRVATVTVISLATVAAWVVDEGLGSPIFSGIQRNFATEKVAAGALAILLAFAADALLVVTQRVLTPWARARAT